MLELKTINRENFTQLYIKGLYMKLLLGIFIFTWSTISFGYKIELTFNLSGGSIFKVEGRSKSESCGKNCITFSSRYFSVDEFEYLKSVINRKDGDKVLKGMILEISDKTYKDSIIFSYQEDFQERGYLIGEKPNRNKVKIPYPKNGISYEQ